MLERTSLQIPPSSQTQTKKNLTESGLEDMVLSLSHRLTCLQSALTSKNVQIDRNQCMVILESKVGGGQLRKAVEEVRERYERDWGKLEADLQQKYGQNKHQIQKLREKLKKPKSQKPPSKPPSEKTVALIKPQQLYLESNETMFSLLVDEITALKENMAQCERNLEQRNRVTVSLNNEVCEKIEGLERQIQARYGMCDMYSLRVFRDGKKDREGRSKLDESHGQRSQNHSRGYWSSSSEQIQPESRIKQTNKTNFNRTEPNLTTANNHNHNSNSPNIQHAQHELSHLSRSVQALQKQLSCKINIKDILPLIKKNLQPLNTTIEQVRKYTQEAIESTKKILINQSEINQQLCTVSKISWWYSFEERDGLAVWNKELANLVPQIFVCAKDSDQILLAQQGTYLVKVLALDGELPEGIIVGDQEMEICGEGLVKVDKGTVVRVPSKGGEMFFSVCKI